MTLLELFDPSLIGRRDKIALEFQGATYTFGDLDARSNRLAQVLQARGLQAGDRLCVYLANCVEMIDLYLASVKLGLIFVPINILYRDREITHILADAAPAVGGAGCPLGWSSAELTKEAANFSDQRACGPSLRRNARRHYLYFRYHRHFQRRRAHAQ